MDDSLKDVRVGCAGAGPRGIAVTGAHLRALLSAGEAALQREGALSWGIQCREGRSWEAPLWDRDTHRNFSYHQEDAVAYSTWSRLVFGASTTTTTIT